MTGTSVAATAAAFNIGWVTGMRDLPGNPAGIRVDAVGEATVLSSAHLADVDFANSAHRLSPRDVPAVTALYRERGIRGWCELVPGPGAADMAAALDTAGWAQVGFHCSLHGPASPTAAAAGSVDVVRVGEKEVQEFSRVLAAGHDVPQEHREVAEAATRAWLTAPGMTLHLALLDGRPAAAGALAISPPVGYLANAATLPEMRGRGAQTALIQARIAAAVQARCDAIVALGEFGSTSQRNLERAGLRVVYTQAVWRMRA